MVSPVSPVAWHQRPPYLPSDAAQFPNVQMFHAAHDQDPQHRAYAPEVFLAPQPQSAPPPYSSADQPPPPPQPPPTAFIPINVLEHPGFFGRVQSAIQADKPIFVAFSFAVISLTLNFIASILFDCGYTAASKPIIGLRLGAAAIGMLSNGLQIGTNMQSTPISAVAVRSTGKTLNPVPACRGERAGLSILPGLAGVLQIIGFIFSGLGLTAQANLIYNISIFLLGFGALMRAILPVDSGGFARGLVVYSQPHLALPRRVIPIPAPVPPLASRQP